VLCDKVAVTRVPVWLCEAVGETVLDRSEVGEADNASDALTERDGSPEGETDLASVGDSEPVPDADDVLGYVKDGVANETLYDTDGVMDGVAERACVGLAVRPSGDRDSVVDVLSEILLLMDSGHVVDRDVDNVGVDVTERDCCCDCVADALSDMELDEEVVLLKERDNVIVGLSESDDDVEVEAVRLRRTVTESFWGLSVSDIVVEADMVLVWDRLPVFELASDSDSEPVVVNDGENGDSERWEDTDEVGSLVTDMDTL